jgi:hypothetical protein
MMDKNTIFDDFSSCVAMWCGDAVDTGELARDAGVIMDKKIPVVSVVPDSIKVIWPWIENVDTKILARFYVADKKISEQQISDLTVNINDALKSGAHGAQIFLPYVAFAGLVEQTFVVRNDLFFNRFLSIGVDINEVDSCDWDDLFQNLHKINASALTLTLSKDMGDKSDFVGRVFGMLDSWNDDNNFELHFVLGQDFYRIEQVVRLIKSVKPELINVTKFFINY